MARRTVSLLRAHWRVGKLPGPGWPTLRRWRWQVVECGRGIGCRERTKDSLTAAYRQPGMRRRPATFTDNGTRPNSLTVITCTAAAGVEVQPTTLTYIRTHSRIHWLVQNQSHKHKTSLTTVLDCSSQLIFIPILYRCYRLVAYYCNCSILST